MQRPIYSIVFAFVAGWALRVSSESPAKLLYQFPVGTWIENLLVRENGDLILTSASRNTLFTYDPASSAAPQIALQFPNATGTTGIAEIAPDEFVIVGGVIDATTTAYTDVTIFLYIFAVPSQR